MSGHGVWGMGHGAWGMGHGAWETITCPIPYSILPIPDYCPKGGVSPPLRGFFPGFAGEVHVQDAGLFAICRNCHDWVF